MPHLLRLSLILVLGSLLASCATQKTPTASTPARGRIQTVRTTAYTHTEGSGGRNAIGQRLSGSGNRSAAADWSRYPLGTRFRLISTREDYVIDDYGGALVGTNTIDLYKTSRSAMNRWGVRQVEIEILHWGSDEESLKVLRPRHKVGRVKRMIVSLEEKQAGLATSKRPL